MGNPREIQQCIGPIINQKQLDKIRDQVEDAVTKGAKVLAGGKTRACSSRRPSSATSRARCRSCARRRSARRTADRWGASRKRSRSPMTPSTAVGRHHHAQRAARARIARRLNTGMAHINDSSVNESRCPLRRRARSGLGRHGGKADRPIHRVRGSPRARRPALPAAVLDEPGHLIEASKAAYLSQGLEGSRILRRLDGTRNSGYWR